MTIWVLRQELTPEEEISITTRTDVRLPFDGVPDLTPVRSLQEARKLLSVLYPGEPPEAIRHRADRFWGRYTGVQTDDLIVVPLFNAKQLAMAVVTGRYHYQVGEGGSDLHLLPVRWYERLVPMSKFNRYRQLFDASNPRMMEVADKEARIALRDCLPHSYNRFAKLKWLLALFFAMGLIRMLSRLGN